MADNILPRFAEEARKEEEQLVALSSVTNEIFVECADRQPLKLQGSESSQFDNLATENNHTLSQDLSSTQPAVPTTAVKTVPKQCEEKTLVDQKENPNNLSTHSDIVAANTEQLHADLNSIICELQRIATDAPETSDNNVFQESAKYAPTETACGEVSENNQIEFLNSVMEDLDVMAENIEHDMDETTRDIGPLSAAVDINLAKSNSIAPKNCTGISEDTVTTDTATGLDNMSNTDSAAESNESSNQRESENQSDPTDQDLEGGSAMAARKRYASTKSRKVEKREESKSQDTISTGDSASLKDETLNKACETKQSKIMQFFTGKRRKKEKPSNLKKASSADFDFKINDDEKSPRLLSMAKDPLQCTEPSQSSTKGIGANKCSIIDNSNTLQATVKTMLDMKNRDNELSPGVGSNENGRRNPAFVESPHVAEVHANRQEKQAASGAASNTDKDKDDDEANEVVLDMEQLLTKLDLSDKIKRQIRQASQLSFQLQSKSMDHRAARDMKRWKSLDAPTYHRTTSQPATSAGTSGATPSPLRTLRPWKIPMAIKMMKNLRKQQSTIEEDRLSLEFFVPGKKTTIRLHRRTFFNFLLKYSIFFFTFIFWIGSLSCISYGAWMLTHKSNIIDNITDVFLDPYVLLCVVGAVVFIVAFIGCLGAVRENIYLLKIFHVSLTFVVVLEVFVGTLVFLFYTMPEFRTAVKVGPEEVLKSAVKRYFDDKVMRDWIDTVQKEFGCCGVSMSNKGYLDWQENQYFNCSDSNPSMHRCSVPLSCCIFEEGDFINYMCGAGIMKEEPTHISHIINTKGCMKSFGEWLAKNDSVIGFAGLGLIGLQILGVVSGRYFIKHLREGDPNRRHSDRIQIGPAEETPAPADA